MRSPTTSVAFALTALLSVPVAVMGQSSDPSIATLGTWKLNVAKSKYEPASAAPKSNMVKMEASQGGVKSTTDGIDAQGKPTHTEIAFKLDGKEYELKGVPDANSTRIYTRIDDRTYQFVNKVGGKVTTTVKAVLAADGKTRTLTTTGKNVQGQMVNNVAIWERQ